MLIVIDSMKKTEGRFFFFSLTQSRAVLCDTFAARQIWSCRQCFTPFHLPCIQHWVRSSLAQAVLAAFNETSASAQRRDWHWYGLK